jgi:hypothetical protein
MNEAQFDAAWTSKSKLVVGLAPGGSEVGNYGADRVLIVDETEATRLRENAVETRWVLEEWEKGRPIKAKYTSFMKEKRRG